MYCGGDCPNPPPISDKSYKVNGLRVLVQYLKMMNCANAALCLGVCAAPVSAVSHFLSVGDAVCRFFLNFVTYLSKNVK